MSEREQRRRKGKLRMIKDRRLNPYGVRMTSSNCLCVYVKINAWTESCYLSKIYF